MALFSKKKGRIKEKWNYDSKSTLLSGPMIYDVDMDGRKEIVFGTKDGKVAVMYDNTDVKWVYDVNEEVDVVESYFTDQESANSINNSPAIGDVDDDGMNEVIFGTEMGYVYMLDNEGMLEWKHEVGDAVRGGILLHDIDNDNMKEIIFGTMNGTLNVLSARNKLIWSHEISSGIEGTPVMIPGTNRVVFGCHDGNVVCVELKKGVVWKFKTGDKVTATPVIENIGLNKNAIIVGSSDFSLYCISKDGKLIWKYDTEGAIVSEVRTADINKDGKNEIVFGSCDNKVYALTQRGDTIWTYDTHFWIMAPPIVEDIDNDGKLEVVVGSYDSNIYVLDSEGIYSLDYMPGLGGVVLQSGLYTEMMTKEPGNIESKKLWQFKTSGFIVGCAFRNKDIVVSLKEGLLVDLIHTDKS